MKKNLMYRNGSVLTSVLAGGALGAGLALLTTPKPGKAIRKDLNRFATQTRDQVSDVVDKGTDLYGDGKDAILRVVDASRDKIDAFRGRKKPSLAAPIIASGILGAGIALLLAPKSGREMRHDLNRFAAGTKEQVDTVIDKSKGLYEGGKSAVTDALDAGKRAYYEGKAKLRRAA